MFPADAPEFLSPPLTQFDLVEGQSSAINLTARANPSQIVYNWSRLSESGANSSGLDNTRFVANGPILNITGVLRSDSGVYKLQASNELGVSETAVKVNVQCMSNPMPIQVLISSCGIDPAQIQRITEMVMVDEWADAYIECYVDANPTPDTTIQWRRRLRNDTDAGVNAQTIDSSRMTTMVESVDTVSSSSQANIQISLKATLVIYNASLEDSGQSFECVANNGVGDTDTAVATLLVLRK